MKAGSTQIQNYYMKAIIWLKVLYSTVSMCIVIFINGREVTYNVTSDFKSHSTLFFRFSTTKPITNYLILINFI